MIRRILVSYLIYSGIASVAEVVPQNSLLNADSKLSAIEKQDQAYLLRHNPFYFAYANPTSKLQLSFKTRFVQDVPLYFGYTQLMFWELLHDSKPFGDLTFNPELFYRFNMRNWGWFLDTADVGWAHNSNGKAGTATRSFNEVYVRVGLKKEFNRWITVLSVRGSYLHAFDDTNKNIQRYIGPLSLKLSFIQLYDAWIDKSELVIQATPGGKFADNWGKGGYQFSASFRLGRMKVIPSFYLQYYTGYAESLLNYNKAVSTFRGGIIF